MDPVIKYHMELKVDVDNEIVNVLITIDALYTCNKKSWGQLQTDLKKTLIDSGYVKIEEIRGRNRTRNNKNNTSH
jgi:hypothetical protein